jgi:hypothetical protein
LWLFLVSILLLSASVTPASDLRFNAAAFSAASVRPASDLRFNAAAFSTASVTPTDLRSDAAGRTILERYAGPGPWEQFGADSIQAYSGAGWRSEAQRAAASASRSLPSIAASLGVRTSDILPLWILVSPGGGGLAREAPEWSAAVAQPERHLIVLDGPALRQTAMDLDETVAHEIAHVALHARLGPDGWVPRWLDEGIAMRLSGYQRWRDRWATLGRGRIHLREVTESFPRDAASARLAYLESEAAVRRLADDGALLPLLRRIADGEDFDEAFVVAYGEPWTAFADAVYSEVSAPWRFIATLGGGVALGAGMAALALLGIVRVQRRNRRRMREWQAEEERDASDST